MVIEVKARIWLELDSKCVIGKGRAELLQKIQKLGSLSEVARSMGMAYSHAWSELKEIEEVVGGPIVTTTRGGKDGGSSRLTRLGEEILHRYQKELNMIERHLLKRNREKND